MKKTLLVLVALLGLSVPAAAQYAPTFVSYSTFTLPGAGNYAWALKNTSAVYAVHIKKVEVGSCNDGSAVSSGLVQFEAFLAASATNGGTVQVSTYAYTKADAFPANVQASTGPVSVVLEGKGAGLQNPVLSPFLVNADETAAANFVDAKVLDYQNTQPIILPRGGTRALVLKQKKAGTSDFTAGCGFARVEFTIK